MLNISGKLHLYEFEDGETHFILAENIESAEKWYREEYALPKLIASSIY